MRKTVLLQTRLLMNGSFVLRILLHPMVNMLGSRKRSSMLLFCAQIAYLLVVSILQLLLWRFFIYYFMMLLWPSWCHCKTCLLIQKYAISVFDEWFSQSLILVSLCQHISKKLQFTFELKFITMNNLVIQIKLADELLKFIRVLRF